MQETKEEIVSYKLRSITIQSLSNKSKNNKKCVIIVLLYYFDTMYLSSTNYTACTWLWGAGKLS